MKKLAFVFSCSLTFLLFSCEENNIKNVTSTDTLKEIISPCKEGGEPNLFVSANNEVYLTWVEYLNDSTDALLFSKLVNEEWSPPITIAKGSDWFVNWADFPSLVSTGTTGKHLAAHWLQKSAEGTYDYDVRIAQSNDSGKNWSPSFILHRDSIAAEHGFVSMLPLSDEKIFATWLDGRNTKVEGNEGAGHGHGHQGAMTLRTAVFDKNAKVSDEAELDNRICDCCQTAAAKTEEGIIIAYRDRSEEEIRDISVVRKVNGKWSAPKVVSDDNWHIAGCPVNGPSIDAYGKNVAIVWFTMKEEKPQVNVAFSKDNGANFESPIRIDEGNPLGRVDLVMISEKEAMVSWVEQNDNGTAFKIAKVSNDGEMGEHHTITVSKKYLQRCFPRMVKNDHQIIFAWTHEDELTNVKTAVMELN